MTQIKPVIPCPNVCPSQQNSYALIHNFLCNILMAKNSHLLMLKKLKKMILDTYQSQNLIDAEPTHQVSWKSIHDCLSNLVNKQRNKPIYKQMIEMKWKHYLLHRRKSKK